MAWPPNFRNVPVVSCGTFAVAGACDTRATSFFTNLSKPGQIQGAYFRDAIQYSVEMSKHRLEVKFVTGNLFCVLSMSGQANDFLPSGGIVNQGKKLISTCLRTARHCSVNLILYKSWPVCTNAHRSSCHFRVCSRSCFAAKVSWYAGIFDRLN